MPTASILTGLATAVLVLALHWAPPVAEPRTSTAEPTTIPVLA